MLGDTENLEFEILGTKVKFKYDDPTSSGKERAQKAVSFVAKEASLIKADHPSMDNAKVLLLVALKLASEKYALEERVDLKLQGLEQASDDILKLIEEVAPSLS